MLVLIDGECVLCLASFHFVALRDCEQLFKFAPIQSGFGSESA
jgi:predicted DCC family thiol-disulfide oxidoreductase YuxK